MFNKNKIEKLTNRIDTLERQIKYLDEAQEQYKDCSNIKFFMLQNPNGKVYESVNIYLGNSLNYQAVANGAIKWVSISINGNLHSYKIYKNNDSTYLVVKIQNGDKDSNVYYYVIDQNINSIIQIDVDITDKLKNCEWIEYKK